MAEVDAAGNVTKSYGYRPGSTWTTDPLFMKVGGQYYFYQNDHLGTPQKLTAVNGAIVWSAKYSSFGEAAVVPTSTVTNNLRFPGQFFDQETGLHYNYHRFYDPTSGRYLRTDPIRLKGGINYYLYAKNNTNNKIDPSGLKSCSDCADCPGGKWEGFTPPGAGMTVATGIGLYSEDTVFWHCKSSSKRCHVIYRCWGVGVIAVGSADIVTNCWASGACNGSDLGGIT